MSAATTQEPTQERARRSVWHAPHLATITAQRYLTTRVVLIALMVVGAFGELSFVKSAFDYVLDQQEVVSWAVAIGVSAISLSMMVFAGHKLQASRAEGERPWPTLALTGGWAFIGIFLVLLRYSAASWSSSSVEVGGSALQLGADHLAQEQGMAGLLAFLYIACGALAFVEGMYVLNLAAVGLYRSRAREAKLHRTAARQRKALVRIAESIEIAKGMVAEQPGTLRSIRIRLAAMFDRLHAVARHRIAYWIADPAGSNVADHPNITEPRTTSPFDDADPEEKKEN